MVYRNVGGAAKSPMLREVDIFRTFVFPNNIRKYRKARSAGSLLQLAQKIPSITYIRLSKIERGEVFARADELRAIATALELDAADLLVDIDDPNFDIAEWAEDYQPPEGLDMEAEEIAVKLAAAVRVQRAGDETLTIAGIEKDYGIAPVILSRIENAYKPLNRWGIDIQQALFRFFEVPDANALIQKLDQRFRSGALDAVLPSIANPENRREKTRAKVDALRAQLEEPAPEVTRRRIKRIATPSDRAAQIPPLRVPSEVLGAIHASDTATVRLLPVFGAPLSDGLIARVATGEQVEAPRNAGPRAYGLRICRPSLGSGLPGRSIAVVDPDRFPSAGGLAVIRESEGLRLLSITFDRQGRMLGYSENPDREIAIDELAPDDVATVLSAHFE